MGAEISTFDIVELINILLAPAKCDEITIEPEYCKPSVTVLLPAPPPPPELEELQEVKVSIINIQVSFPMTVLSAKGLFGEAHEVVQNEPQIC